MSCCFSAPHGQGLMDKREECKTPGYSHTQRAPMCLILYGSALACFAGACIIEETSVIFIVGGASLLMVLLAPAFHRLSVVDQGDVLAIRFGPLPLSRRTVRYTDIEMVEVGRTLVLDGWGIHYSITGGWVWNLWGRDCVEVHFKRGILRIGTDDATNLAGFLGGKIGHKPPA
jgi:hypothetical protein